MKSGLSAPQNLKSRATQVNKGKIMLEHAEILLRFAINFIAVLLLMFALYYSRHKKKETVIAATLFNTFAFAVLSVLSSAQFGVKVGFGLFAILAMFALRSETIKQLDIAYFFGALTIATLTSLQAIDFDYIIMILSIILLAAYLVDHPRILRTATQANLILDSIPAEVASNPAKLNAEIAERLGVVVLSTEILSINYVTEVVEVIVNYRAE